MSANENETSLNYKNSSSLMNSCDPFPRPSIITKEIHDFLLIEKKI